MKILVRFVFTCSLCKKKVHTEGSMIHGAAPPHPKLPKGWKYNADGFMCPHCEKAYGEFLRSLREHHR